MPIPFQYFTPEPGNQMIRECGLRPDADLRAERLDRAAADLATASRAAPRATRTAPGPTPKTTRSTARSRTIRRFGQRAAIGAATAILASSGGDTISAIPAGRAAIGGPVISHVYQQSRHGLHRHGDARRRHGPDHAVAGGERLRLVADGWRIGRLARHADRGDVVRLCQPDQGQGDLRLGAVARGGFAAAVLSLWRNEPRRERRRHGDRPRAAGHARTR